MKSTNVMILNNKKNPMVGRCSIVAPNQMIPSTNIPQTPRAAPMIRLAKNNWKKLFLNKTVGIGTNRGEPKNVRLKFPSCRAYRNKRLGAYSTQAGFNKFLGEN